MNNARIEVLNIKVFDVKNIIECHLIVKRGIKDEG